MHTVNNAAVADYALCDPNQLRYPCKLLEISFNKLMQYFCWVQKPRISLG